jgi:hypothetical protein
MITEITIKIIDVDVNFGGGGGPSVDIGVGSDGDDDDDGSGGGDADIIGGEKLETKLNEVFDGLDKIDKVGIGSSLNPVPKQNFFLKKNISTNYILFCLFK